MIGTPLPWTLLLALAPAQQPPLPDEAELLAARLCEHVDQLAAADLFSGTLKLTLGPEVLAERAWGEASKSFHAPNEPHTRFNLASASKMFTAVMIAQLVEQGALRYEDPVGRHLPGLTSERLRETVELRHLLAHTSGLGELMDERWERSSRSLWREVDDWMSLVRDAEPEFEPGSRFRYSNAGYLLLGAVLEAATGRSYEELLRARILEPAGMAGAGLFCLDEPLPDVAQGYSHQRFGSRGGDAAFADRWWSTQFCSAYRGSPAGGAYATADDMTRFLQALHDGRLLPERALAVLLEPRVAMDRGDVHYGYGFMLGGRPGARYHGHAGDAWGASTMARCYPERGLTLVVLSNYGDGAARLVGERFDALLAGGELGDAALRFVSGDADPQARADLLAPAPLTAEESARYTRVARLLIRAINAEDARAYAELLAPGFAEGLDEENPWKLAFATQLGHFGRIQTAWSPRRKALEAGPGVRFAGHAGGVSVLVRFEEGASGTLTFTLDAQDRVAAGSCWFKRGFVEGNVGPKDEKIFELD